MTDLTPSQIGKLRTAIDWIETEAAISKHNSGLLGCQRTDEEIIKSELCTTLDNIATTTQKAKRILLGVKEKRPKVCLDNEQDQTPGTIRIIRTATNWLKNETADVDDIAGLLGRPDTREKPTLYKMYFKIFEVATNANMLAKLVLGEINKEQSE